MARSSYIYIFQNTNTNEILAAFTVKHEAQAWYNNNDDFPETIKAYRVRDGGRGSIHRDRTFEYLTDVTEDFKS